MARYEVTGELGRGSMGIVHRAHDAVMGRDVALKTILLPHGLPTDKKEEFQQRFLREAQAAGRLSHPGIVTVYDFNQDGDGDGDLPYIAMEFVQGSTLHELISQEGSLKPEWVLAMGDTLADALQAAYDAGIVHRDLKPANILVREADGVAKITDFGIARVSYSELTNAGTTYGSPAYMAPERIRGQQADLRSDLFSLAVILYEALCSQRPFGGDDFASICFSILNDPPASIRSREPGLTPAFDAFFDTALAKDADRRFQTGEEFRQALETVRHQQVLFSSGAATMLMAARPVPSRSDATDALDDLARRTLAEGADPDRMSSSAELVAEEDDAEPSLLPTWPYARVETPSQRSFKRWLGAGIVALLAVLIGLLALVDRRESEPLAHLSEADTLIEVQEGPDTAEAQPPERDERRATHAVPPSLAEAPSRPNASAAPRASSKRAAAPAPQPERRAQPPSPPPAREQAATSPPLAVETPVVVEAIAPTPPVEHNEATPQAARLNVTVRSSVRQGQLLLLADGTEVLSTPLEAGERGIARALNKVVGKTTDGLEVAIEVPAATRELTVRVYSEAKSRWFEDQLGVELAPGAAREIEVVAGRAIGPWLTIRDTAPATETR